MSRSRSLAEVAAASVITVLLLTLSPGIAVAALIALAVLVICGVAVLVGRLRSSRVQPRERRR